MSEDRFIQLLNTALSNQYRLIIGEVRIMFRIQRTEIMDDTKQMLIALENRMDEKLDEKLFTGLHNLKEELETTISESAQTILDTIHEEYSPKFKNHDQRLTRLERKVLRA